MSAPGIGDFAIYANNQLLRDIRQTRHFRYIAIRVGIPMRMIRVHMELTTIFLDRFLNSLGSLA
jgi:hypothetical protein